MAPVSDYIKATLVIITFPLSAYLAQTSHQSLWGILLLSNPFTIFLLISTIARLSILSGHSDSTLVIDLQAVNAKPSYTPLDDGHHPDKSQRGSMRQSERPTCCSMEADLIYWLHKYYAYSFHTTLLIITRENLLVGQLMSRCELISLYGSLIVLVGMVLNLRDRVRWRTLDSIQSSCEANEREDDVGSTLIPSPGGRVEVADFRCEQICYIKLLAHPTTVMRNLVLSSGNCPRLRLTNNEEDKAFSDRLVESNDATLPIPYEHMDRLQYNGQKVDDLHMIKRAARLSTQARVGKHNSASWLQRVIVSKLNLLAESRSYLLICHLVHLFVLVQYSYLNLTFSCASKPSSTFGVTLLIPYDCSDVFEVDNTRQRLSMFVGIASSQLFLCQLVMLALNVKYFG